jgi:hypothetical protein
MPSTALSEIFSEQGKKENCARGQETRRGRPRPTQIQAASSAE